MVIVIAFENVFAPLIVWFVFKVAKLLVSILPPLPGVIFWIALSTYAFVAALLSVVGVGIVIGCVNVLLPPILWSPANLTFWLFKLSTYLLFAASWSAVGSATLIIFLLLVSTWVLGSYLITPLSAPIIKLSLVELPLPKYQTLWLFDLKPAR